MKQREVQGGDNVVWTCVQPLSGLSGEAREAAEEKLASGDGSVPVVCTPAGGEQSVRLSLSTDWCDELSDDALLAEIDAARDAR